MTDLKNARSMISEAWLRAFVVPPLVLPIVFGVMIAAYVLYSALM